VARSEAFCSLLIMPRIEPHSLCLHSINRVLRMMLHMHWSAEGWSRVRVEFKRGLALRSQIRRAG